MSLPTADDLFRPTATGEYEDAPVESAPPAQPTRLREARAVPDEPAEVTEVTEVTEAEVTEAQAEAEREDARKRRSSGRVRHDEKMTVYVTADELLDIEHARLSLRREHGLAVDRGRLVREAIAIALADLERSGGDSVLVQRLNAS